LRVVGLGLRFILAPLGMLIRVLEPLVSLAPVFLNGLARLAPFVIRGLIMAFGLLSNPVGWAVILAGVAAALVWYFRADIAKAWPKVVDWFRNAFTGLRNWIASINWRGIGMGIADSLTFGLASKFANAMSSLKASVPSTSVGMNSTRGGLAGARAGGGRVRRGASYLVGERGREISTAGADGYVSSNARLESALARSGRGAGVTVGSITINGANDPESTRRIVRQELQRLADNSSNLND
jgi:hypothetical protein